MEEILTNSLGGKLEFVVNINSGPCTNLCIVTKRFQLCGNLSNKSRIYSNL